MTDNPRWKRHPSGSTWSGWGRTIAQKIAAIAMHDRRIRGRQMAGDWKFAADLLQRQQN